MTGFAVAPETRPEMHSAFVEAVRSAGGDVVELAQADVLVWADPLRADLYPEVAAGTGRIAWVQLPYAGVEPFADYLDDERIWTCGKGVYAAPVAEHVMACALTAFRDLHHYIPARSWGAQRGRNLLGASVAVLGGGGITTELVKLLEPWHCDLSVVRRSPDPFPGASRTFTTDRLHEALATAELVVVALALTAETARIIDASALAAMRTDAWLVNVARGGHVDHDALEAALKDGSIAGAVLDVTEPEPLPDDSPLWGLDNCIITPHVANTPEMGLPLIAGRVRENALRWLAGEALIGVVDVAAGY